MDPALARMMARKRQQQEDAEDEEWRPTSTSRSTTPFTSPPEPSKPNLNSATQRAMPSMDEDEPTGKVFDDLHLLRMCQQIASNP
jgi:hypothetical protein